MQRTIILLLIALLLPSVSAQDFLAFGDTAVDVVPCGTAIRNVTIQNTRETQATYSLSVDGDASEYVTFSTINFALDPGQSAVINTYYNIPCDVKPGTYSTDLYFDDGEIEKVLTQDVNIAVPDNVNVTATKTESVIAPCETAAYTLGLQNPLNFTEIYNIEASGHPDVQVSEKTAVLQNGEVKNIIVSVTPEDCTQSGTFSLIVNFETDKSNQKEEIALELIIKSTDIPILAEGVNKIRTDYVDSTAELIIENTGDRITQYSLVIEGADWASISPNTLSLNPGRSRAAALRLNPSEEISTGNYPLTLFATVDETGIVYSKELTIRLQPPTAIEKRPVFFIILAIVILALLAAAVYGIKYVRSPAFKEKRRKRKEKREAKRKLKEQKRAELFRKKLEQRRKVLERKKVEQERIKKQIQKEIEKDFNKKYHLIARKDIVVGKQKSSVLKIVTLVLGVLILLLIISAWSIIAPNIAYVLLGVAILVVIYLAKRLARCKVIRARWKMLIGKQTVNLQVWKKGLSQLSITAKNPIKKFGIQIRKTKVKVTPSAAVYQTFTIKTNAEVQFKATFTVSKQWLARKNAKFDDVRVARYTGQSWSTVSLRKTGEGKKFVHFAAALDKTGTYSLYAKVKKKPASETRKLIWGVAGVAIVVAIALLLSPRAVTQGIPPQSWQQDMVHKVDLSKYFNDPDGDALTFSATEAEHVMIEITGNTAYLTPETGWTGEEKIKFMATDDKGGKVESNTVPLRVKKQLIPAKIQPYIAVVLAILAILLLLWTVRSQKKK